VEILVEKRDNRPSALRRVLVDAIESLKPDRDVPPDSRAWRLHHILVWRYVEQSSQQDVAANLSISPRQLRRLEQEAIEVLADYLWSRFDLGKRESLVIASPQRSRAVDRADGSKSERRQEIEWLKKSLPSELIDVCEVVRTSLATVEPLMRELGVHVECSTPEGVPLVAGQLTPVRQALLNVVTAVARYVPSGRLQIIVDVGPQGPCVRVGAQPQDATAVFPTKQFVENLNMARQLISVFGGQLEILPGQDTGQGLALNLLLSASERLPVLVIDDNEDALRLFERYLSGTRYRFVGVRDPRGVLDLAEDLRPQIIILDVMLPGTDGWELLGRLRAHPETCDIPVLVCTILPQESLALALGAAAFMRKPVSREALLSILDLQVGLRSTESH
jgi:CheY-like chemotaxis protein